MTQETNGQAQQPEPMTQEQAQAIWDAELAAGSAASDAPAADAAPASDPLAENEAAAPAPEPAAADPFEGVPPAVRAMLEENQRQLSRLSNIEGHIGGLHSAIKRLNGEVAAAKQATERVQAAGGEAPTAQQQASARGNSAKWDQLREDFPEWADAIDERLGGAQQEQPKVDADAIVKQATEAAQAAADARLAAHMKQLNEERVEERFPGWKGTINTPEFGAWFDTLPATERALGNSDRPSDAIALLTKFTTYQGRIAKAQQTAQQRTQRLQEAAALPAGMRGASAPTDLESMTPEQVWQFYANNPQMLDRPAR